ncbi:MAG: ABC transporter ATP-binding protein [Hyphomicrobiaceae bacterium]
MSRPIIATTDLDTFYDESHILRGVSMQLTAGETVGLMGRNGMGKTTLIRTIMGLVRPRSGTVRIDDCDVTHEPTHRIAQRGIAYVPEGRGIFGSLSVRENLEIAARPGHDGSSAWTPERTLETFPRLAQRYTTSGHQLSGGEQQMLAIARALVTNPRVLILDEATEGLAPLIRNEIWRTIDLVRQTGIASLIVDKTISEVAAVADRIIVLVKGELVYAGPSGQLTSNQDLLHRYLGV